MTLEYEDDDMKEKRRTTYYQLVRVQNNCCRRAVLNTEYPVRYDIVVPSEQAIGSARAASGSHGTDKDSCAYGYDGRGHVISA